MNETIRIKSDKIILKDGIFSGYVYFTNGKITAVCNKELPFDKEYDKTELYVSPGFIDIHTHGGAGCEFFCNSLDIIEGCNFHLSHGTTSICPTVSAAPFNIMAKSVNEVKKAFPGLVFETTIPRNVRLSEAPSFGEPVIYYDRASRGSESYMALAEEFLKMQI